MATFQTLEAIATSFPEVTVEPHFEKISFRVRKKIVATFDVQLVRASVKLTSTNQEQFASMDRSIYPVDNKWGEQGWTYIELEGVTDNVLREVLQAAYCEVAPKNWRKLSAPKE